MADIARAALHSLCKGWMFVQVNWVSLGLALFAALLAGERWVRAREARERAETSARETLAAENQHQRELMTLKHENAMLAVNVKHDSDRARRDEQYQHIIEEIRRLRDKASENHGETQRRVGEMELKVAAFISKSEAQMKEIYHLVGRRLTDAVDDIVA